MTVPTGTVQDVLDWVGGDPDRAHEALAAEHEGQNRSTLITQLEAIANKEATDVTETTEATEEEVVTYEDIETPEVVVDPEDNATTVLPLVVANSEIDTGDFYDDDGNVVLPEGGAVETLTGAVAPHGFILVINGEAFAFSPQLLASLKTLVDHGVAGVTL